MRTLGNPRGNCKVQPITASFDLEIDRGGGIPVNVLVKVKQVGESRFVTSTIGERLGNLAVLRNVPEHALFKAI